MLILLATILAALFVTSCSSISHLENDEQLFTGLAPISYTNINGGAHAFETQEELEAALAIAPNGALFGSPYYRTIPYGLWIYNAYHEKKSGFAKWLTSSFGKAPVLMSRVNPELRSSVAESVLQNHGYFQGKVDYSIIYGKPKKTKHDSIPRPRTAKIGYRVDMGQLYTIDTISYSNFQDESMAVLMNTQSLLHKGDPFNISALDMERTRIYETFRNLGYYYYQQPFTTFFADTLNTNGKVRLKLHLADSLDSRVTRKWVIGKVDVKIQRQIGQQLTDSIDRRLLKIHFAGKRPPLRPRVVLSDVKLRPGQFFSQDKYEESLMNLSAKGIYSSSSIQFTPRVNADGTDMIVSDTVKATNGGIKREGAGVLDMTINCILDKPYDFTLQANYLGKTSGRMGPGVSLGFAKRNAFRGGELLSFNLSANYEFQTGATASASNNNYEISGDLALTMPRLLLPYAIIGKRRRWQTTPSTVISVARETINRSGFFRRHILSGELSYIFQNSMQSHHQFSPLILEYDHMASISAEYKKMIDESPILMATSKDYLMPKMRYNYRYTSPLTYHNPIFLSITAMESSNLLALGYLATGSKWNEKDKTAFRTPFAQFVKLEMDWKKTWRTGDFSSLHAHVQTGVLKCYGNSEKAPYSEQFYVGGANSIRAFSARSIGPGHSYNPNKKFSYVTNTGDIKLVMNLEYRPRLFGSLYGAVFLDAGNVWDFKDMAVENSSNGSVNDGHGMLGDGKGRKLEMNRFLKDMAVGTGVGIRYDLDFFVLRIDWGFVIHDPSGNSATGYFNIPRFSKAQCLNFAIGYPF